MSENDDLVYTVLLKERSSGGSSHDNGLEGIADECTLLECGLEGANILQQMEIYAFKSDGQFEVKQRSCLYQITNVLFTLHVYK
jgi:mediator of RNA polymerase II transcription subunit 20